jgi:uncharacterized membrane protein
MSQRRLETKDRARAVRDYELSRGFEGRAAWLLEELKLHELTIVDGMAKLELLIQEARLAARIGEEK